MNQVMIYISGTICSFISYINICSYCVKHFSDSKMIFKSNDDNNIIQTYDKITDRLQIYVSNRIKSEIQNSNKTFPKYDIDDLSQSNDDYGWFVILDK